MRRLLSIGFIWLCCAAAWMVLGSSVVHRTGESSSVMRGEVALLWGPALVQAPPLATPLAAGTTTRPAAAEPNANAATASTTEAPLSPFKLDGSDIDVSLQLEHRRKGLMWFATYGVAFSGRYTFRNSGEVARRADLHFPLAGQGVVYDAFKVLDGDGEPVDATIANGQAVWQQSFEPGEAHEFTVVYQSRGTTSWSYLAGQGTSQLNNFKLDVDTNVAAVDFPAGTISPSSHQLTDNGWHGRWAFDSLVSSANIAIDLPQKLNPGPVVSRITFFAPVSLLFFFFVVAILAAARNKQLHPMHFFMLGCAFFAFHLLFAYLVDHVAVFTSFGIAAVASVALVVSYTRLFVGWRFALMEVGISQLLYLVLFSFTFFLKGFTGLAITIGATLTLFVIMQITGRLDWSEAASLLRRDDDGDPEGGMSPGGVSPHGVSPHGVSPHGASPHGVSAGGAASFHAFTHMPPASWQDMRARQQSRRWQYQHAQPAAEGGSVRAGHEDVADEESARTGHENDKTASGEPTPAAGHGGSDAYEAAADE